MGGIESFVVLAMASLYLAIMSWGIGTDQLMLYPMLLQMKLEQGRLFLLRGEAVGKLRTVIRLDALNGERESFYHIIHKKGGTIGVVFLKSLHKTPSGIFINGSILEEMLSNHLAIHKAGRRDKFHIYLDTLTRMIHLLIGLGDILGIWGMYCHDALPFEESIEAGNGTGIAALHELYPENDETSIRVAPAHIEDKFDFLRGMLVGMMVRLSGTVTQGLDGAIKAAFPAVNILPVGLVFNGGISNSVFVSVLNKR